ncbi:hypothetical protein LCGC14_0322780 [marine sediment metagenome]|uniref:Uncharacterized protein n=1 Tax=marine sediment metagenome TaxID=412755 RepID=A0A0F9TP03_9ZZZZ
MAFLADGLSSPLFQEWSKTCDLPKECRRMAIDVAVDDVVIVYYECFGDEETLAKMPSLKGAKVVHVASLRPNWLGRALRWFGQKPS